MKPPRRPEELERRRTIALLEATSRAINHRRPRNGNCPGLMQLYQLLSIRRLAGLRVIL